MTRDFDPAEPELMDRPQPVSAELERDLENLASLNRWFGSHRLLRKFLRKWWQPGASAPTVLDLCTGAGDLPLVMAQYARDRHIPPPRIIAVDANPATLDIARRRCRDYPEIEFVEGDALSPPGPFPRYDLVHCSLALHHFSEADAVALLRRARTLGKRVLVSDLERAWFTSLGVWLLTAFIYREPMTQHDGRASARRAFSFGEMRALVTKAGWEKFGHARFAFCRQALWIE